MSRSRRKTPKIGNVGSRRESEKQDKRHANRILRKAVKASLSNEAEVLPELREVSNVWGFSKDGKSFFDAERWPEMMRK